MYRGNKARQNAVAGKRAEHKGEFIISANQKIGQ